jgi:DNA-binding transcriptional LysR family regulator
VNEIGWSCVPAMSVASYVANKKVLALDLPTHIKDEVSIWWLRSRKETAINIKNLCQWIDGF